LSVRGALRVALLLALALGAAPAQGADEAWSDADVEAAERYRAEERERAERYRAQVEEEARERPAAPSARASGSGAPLGERIAARVRAWLEGVLADVLRALGDALRSALAELLGGNDRPARRDLAPPPARFADWLSREEARAGAWLEGRAEDFAPAPESEREWRRRDAERARELAKREAEAARERGRRRAERAREDRERAEWQERWHDADAWWEEERARQERGARD
jgi:hypothetical protein